MRRIKQGAIAMLLAVMVVVGCTATAPASTLADVGQTCADELGVRQPADEEAASKTPVVFVHGLWSDAGTWTDGPDSMSKAIGPMSEAAPVYFDYGSANAKWVTVGDTAQRLAKTIVCYSKLYGGKRVIVVAHSMGGLLTREALSWPAYGTFAKEATGHIVTLGTPHKGANLGGASYGANIALCKAAFVWWGREASENCEQIEGEKAVSAMRPGSPQLAELPVFPEDVTVEAIAGDVSWVTNSPWSQKVADMNSDLVVSVDSATDESTETGVGDGVVVFECNSKTPVSEISDAWCTHNNMVHAPQVQREVKRSIKEYLDSVPVPHNFYGLQLQLPAKLEVRHESEYSTTVRDMTNCGDLRPEFEDYPVLACAAVEFTNYSKPPPPGGPMDGAYCDVYEDHGQVLVGGRSARYSTGKDCGNGLLAVDGDMRMWDFEVEKLRIEVYDPAGSPLEGIEEALKEAVWTN